MDGLAIKGGLHEIESRCPDRVIIHDCKWYYHQVLVTLVHMPLPSIMIHLILTAEL